MAAKELNAIVTQRLEINPGLIKLRVIPEGWELPDFEPGQFTTLGLPGTAPRSELAVEEERKPTDLDKMIMRAYSVASSSIAKEYLEFYVGIVRSGSLSTRLFNLKPNDKLWISPKFKGMFTLEQVPENMNVILIATGTGVAPYMSMIRIDIARGLKRKYAIFHGAYYSYDLGYHSELTTLDSLSDMVTYIPTLSHASEEPALWKGKEGFVQKLWTDQLLNDIWRYPPTPENSHIFLCGNPFMINEMEEILFKEGFVEHTKKTPGQVHSEKFFVKLD